MRPRQNNGGMGDYLRTYWPVIIFLVGTFVSLVTQWAVLGIRLSNVEARQDRQGDAITDVKNQLTQQAANYAELKAKLDAISDNVAYIRSRMDKLTN